VTASASRADAASREEVLRPFVQRKAFKVIAGLKNFNSKNVAEIVAAAEQGGATHVDIACDPELVKLACSITKIPVCVSAVDPELFVPAVAAGATMAEIGNYDPFYAEGRVFDAAEVLALTKRTRALLPHIPLSVTVPHTLALPDQVHLAELLEKAGADIIQTEGGVSSAPTQAGVAGMIEKASPTLAAAYSISRAVSIPVMCASGISDVTASMAIAAGAAGIGVGSAINKLNSGIAMIAATRAIANALGLVSHRESTDRLLQQN
jgi:hypothetical protein